jgi:hypothetical protein
VAKRSNVAKKEGETVVPSSPLSARAEVGCFVLCVCRRHAALLLQQFAPKMRCGVVPMQCGKGSATSVMFSHTQGGKPVSVPSGGGDDAAEAGGVRKVASRGAGGED